MAKVLSIESLFTVKNGYVIVCKTDEGTFSNNLDTSSSYIDGDSFLVCLAKKLNTATIKDLKTKLIGMEFPVKVEVVKDVDGTANEYQKLDIASLFREEADESTSLL